LAALGAQQLPLGAQIAFDIRLAGLELLGSVALGILVSLPVAWFNLHTKAAPALPPGNRGGTASRDIQRLRAGFIVAQIAVAFVLLAGAGLLGLSLKRAMAVSPGFRPDHTLAGQISLPWVRYQDWPDRLGFIGRLLDGVKGQPGVIAAGVIDTVPFSGDNMVKTAFGIQGHVPKPGESLRAHYFYGVGGDIFPALGIPLRDGRFLGSADSDRRVCVVDEDFAKTYWPEGGAIGHRLSVGANAGPDSESFAIVGVVGSVKEAALTDNSAQGAVYFPYKFRTVVDMFAVVRTGQTPEFFGPTLQKIVRDIDPELPLNNPRPMELRIADSLVTRRSPALLAGVFAVVALLLAAVGTYGVLAYAFGQRRREIGVRMALGALPRQIGGQFLSIGLRLLAAGLGFGLIGAWLAGLAMRSLLFNVPPAHLPTLLATAATLAVIALLACWIPARRAARIDPSEALRCD
jgi:predicted permease